MFTSEIRNHLNVFSALILALVITSCSAPQTSTGKSIRDGSDDDFDGIRFYCDNTEEIEQDLQSLLALHNLEGYVQVMSNSDDGVTASLNTREDDTDTLNLPSSGWSFSTGSFSFRNRHGSLVTEPLVSEREILVSLLQHGRATKFRGDHCSVDALREHIAIRQNIAKWAQIAFFAFPDDGTVDVNGNYWEDSWVVAAGVSPSNAVADAFTGNMTYEAGCTDVAAMITQQGIRDYFENIAPGTRLPPDHTDVFDGLENDREPIADIADASVQGGKTMVRLFSVPWNNWVAGDWGWIKNTDRESSEIHGLEGSNIIYIGRGKFAAYYSVNGSNDYSIEDKLWIVYNWRWDEVPERQRPADPANRSEILESLKDDPYDSCETSDAMYNNPHNYCGILRDVRDIPKGLGTY